MRNKIKCLEMMGYEVDLWEDWVHVCFERSGFRFGVRIKCVDFIGDFGVEKVVREMNERVGYDLKSMNYWEVKEDE